MSNKTTIVAVKVKETRCKDCVFDKLINECRDIVDALEALGLPCCSKGYIYEEETVCGT